MDEEKVESLRDIKNCCKEGCCKDKWFSRGHHHHHGGGNGSAVYCLGVIGAFVYYYPHCVVFNDYLWSFLKSMVWPALLVHKAFTLLGM